MTTKIKVIKINKKAFNHHLKNNTLKCRVCRYKFKLGDNAVSKYVASLGTIAKYYDGGYNHYRISKVKERQSRRVLYCLKCAIEKNLIEIKGGEIKE